MTESQPSTTRESKPPQQQTAGFSSAKTAQRLPTEPMAPQLIDIQPGGGVIIRLEQQWGRMRRWYLKTFRPGYVARMQGLRQGEHNPCPHEVLDPRDLKFHRNQGGWFWRTKDDPFTWRERIPFARSGLAELILIASLAFGVAGLLALISWQQHWQGIAAWLSWAAVSALSVIGLLVVWFFRDPNREVPQGERLVVSPADGKVVTIREIEHEEYIGGPAIEIGIFLSIFSVHINRMPVAARVIGLRYRPGKCLNALRSESARENEQLAIRIEANAHPHRRMIVRQITGAIARRIVCWLKPGDELTAGERLGMIKLGSRTELVLPREESLELRVQVGQMVKAGSSVLAEYPGKP